MVTQNMLRMHEGNKVFSDKNIRLLTALDVIKCLIQVEKQRMHPMCAPINSIYYKYHCFDSLFIIMCENYTQKSKRIVKPLDTQLFKRINTSVKTDS